MRGEGGARARSAGGRPCAGGGELRVRAGVGGHPRRLGRRGDQGRAPDVGRPGPPGGRVGRAGRVNGVVATCSRSATAASGRSASTSTPTRAGRSCMSLVDTADVFLTNLLPAARTEARHRARRHPGPQPAHRLRPGHGPGPAWPAGRQGRLRRHHLLGSLRRGDRRHAARPGVPVADARPRLRRPAVGHGAGRRHRRRAVPARAHRASAPIVDVSLMSAGLWAMGMTISGASVLDVDELPAPGRTRSRRTR